MRCNQRLASLGLVLLLAWAAPVWAIDAGLVTALSGAVKLHEESAAGGPASALEPFVKLRVGDRLTLTEAARVQLVYFDGGRQETWQGRGELEIGERESIPLSGKPSSEVKVLPAILVRQLTKTPSPGGNVRAGMVRMRAMPLAGTLESLERRYAELKKQADAQDHNPELYLLAGYFELREFERLDALLARLTAAAADDTEIQTLSALYRRAVADARQSEGR